MATPCLHVFSITEILELILMALPMTDILLLQRVCRSWKLTVAGSLKLQRLLFMTADGLTDSPDHHTIARNPLLAPLFASWVRVDADGKINLHPSWEYASASWRSMLLTKPALVSVRAGMELWMKDTPKNDPYVPDFKIIGNEHGVTAGEVLDWVKGRREDTLSYWKAEFEKGRYWGVLEGWSASYWVQEERAPTYRLGMRVQKFPRWMM